MQKKKPPVVTAYPKIFEKALGLNRQSGALPPL
jgi:hypothetical protein